MIVTLSRPRCTPARTHYHVQLQGFPAEELLKYNVSAQHPDDFIFDLFDLHAAKVLQAAARHRKSMKKPPKSVEEYLDTLAAQGLTQTVSALRP